MATKMEKYLEERVTILLREREEAEREALEYQAMMFRMQINMQAQNKGLKRLAKKMRRFEAMKRHIKQLETESAMAARAIGNVRTQMSQTETENKALRARIAALEAQIDPESLERIRQDELKVVRERIATRM